MPAAETTWMPLSAFRLWPLPLERLHERLLLAGDPGLGEQPGERFRTALTSEQLTDVLTFNDISINDGLGEALIGRPEFLCPLVGEDVKFPSRQGSDDAVGDY